MNPTHLVILDRDGVINHDSEEFIRSPDEWIPIEGSLEAIASLNQNAYRVVIATNQSGIGRSLFEVAALNQIHAKMHRALAAAGARVEGIFFCPHTPEDHCSCRKPLPGLFTDIARRFDVDLTDTWTVGDARRDLEAGVAAGCRPILVRTGKGVSTEEAGGLPAGTLVFDDLAAAVVHILAATKEP